MKRILILASFLACLFALIKSPLAEKYLSLGSFAFWNTQQQIEQQQSRLAAKVLLDRLDDMDFETNKIQQAYLEKITESLDELLLFQQRYCINNDKNPIVFGEQLSALCDQLPSVLAPSTDV